MTLSEVVDYLLNLHPSFLHISLHVFRMIHLRVAVGKRGEVETGEREAHGCRLVFLAIPQCLHDVESRLAIHDLGRTTQDAHYLLSAEAVEELRHPDSIVVSVGRQRSLWVEQVGAEAVDAFSSRLALGRFLHQANLLWQVEDGDSDFRVIANTLHCPSTGVATHVEQGAGLVYVKHNLQSFREGAVAVEMVEAEPALLHLRLKRRQSFVDGRPFAQSLQTCRTTFLERLLKVEPSKVVDIVVEVDVDARSLVRQQEESRLRDAEPVGRVIDEDGTDTERSIGKTLHCIIRQASRLDQLLTCHAFRMGIQKVENTKLDHQS